MKRRLYKQVSTVYDHRWNVPNKNHSYIWMSGDCRIMDLNKFEELKLH